MDEHPNFTVTASVALLGRLASAGIEPLTLAVGQAVCAGLVLGPTGERRLQESLNNLKSFSSFGDAIWFGLGVRHVVRTLVQTAQGASCVALTASLAEVHNVEVTALVLYNLVKIQQAPIELSPSFPQWKALAQTCASVFKTSSFSLRVQTLLSMMDKWPDMDENPEACAPADLAEVLQAVTMVKNGKKRSVTLVGGPDCAWVIAYADWLLALRVLLHGHNGDLLYKNFDGPNDEVQVSAQYARDGSIDSKTIRKIGESYILRSGKHLITEQLSLGARSYEMLPIPSISANVQWTQALSITFGDETVQRLLRHCPIVYSVLTSALQNFQQDHEGLRYDASGLGNPLMENVVRWFPELNALRHLGEFDDVGKNSMPPQTYCRCLKNLMHNCGCCQCHSALMPINSAQSTSRPRVCLVSLTEMIIILCHCLSQTVLDSALYPTVRGLRGLYQSSNTGWSSRTHSLDTEEALYYPRTHEKGGLLPGEIYFELFTGYAHTIGVFSRHRGFGPECASSWHGIRWYSETLLALSDQYGQASRVHVTAGVIESSGRTYSNVHGLAGWSSSEIPTASPFKVSNLDTFDTIKQYMPELDFELVVENVDVLKVAYRIFNQEGSLWIDPVQYLFSLTEAAQDSLEFHSKVIMCAGHNPSESRDLLSKDLLDHYLIQGIGNPSNIGERRKWLYRPLLTMLCRCAALQSTTMSSRRTILLGHQCLLCIKQAIEESEPPQPRSHRSASETIIGDTAFILESVDCFATVNTNS